MNEGPQRGAPHGYPSSGLSPVQCCRGGPMFENWDGFLKDLKCDVVPFQQDY